MQVVVPLQCRQAGPLVAADHHAAVFGGGQHPASALVQREDAAGVQVCSPGQALWQRAASATARLCRARKVPQARSAVVAGRQQQQAAAAVIAVLSAANKLNIADLR